MLFPTLEATFTSVPLFMNLSKRFKSLVSSFLLLTTLFLLLGVSYTFWHRSPQHLQGLHPQIIHIVFSYTRNIASITHYIPIPKIQVTPPIIAQFRYFCSSLRLIRNRATSFSCARRASSIRFFIEL